METKNYEQALKKEFLPNELGYKPQGKPITYKNPPQLQLLVYVDARAIQDRLDSVFGAFNWQTAYRKEGEGFICTLSVQVQKDGKYEWISKEDGSPESDVEGYKGGISTAFKRVASAGFGMGRYLYESDNIYVDLFDSPVKGSKQYKDTSGKVWYYLPPNSKNANTSYSTPSTPSTPSTNSTPITNTADERATNSQKVYIDSFFKKMKPEDAKDMLNNMFSKDDVKALSKKEANRLITELKKSEDEKRDKLILQITEKHTKYKEILEPLNQISQEVCKKDFTDIIYLSDALKVNSQIDHLIKESVGVDQSGIDQSYRVFPALHPELDIVPDTREYQC